MSRTTGRTIRIPFWIVCALVVGGCRPTRSLVGTWHPDKRTSQNTTQLTFNADGTFERHTVTKDEDFVSKGTWRLKGDVLQGVSTSMTRNGRPSGDLVQSLAAKLTWISDSQIKFTSIDDDRDYAYSRGAPPPGQPVAEDPEKAAMRPIGAVDIKLYKGRPVSESEWKTVLQGLDSPFGVVVQDAMLTIGSAVEKGVKPEEPAFSLVEARVVRAKGHAAADLIDRFASVLHVPEPPNQGLDDESYKVSRAHMTGEPLAAQEKAFIVRVLADPDPANKRLASRIMVQAGPMPSEDKDWVLAKVDAVMKQTSGREHRLWRTVRETISGQLVK